MRFQSSRRRRKVSYKFLEIMSCMYLTSIKPLWSLLIMETGLVHALIEIIPILCKNHLHSDIFWFHLRTEQIFQFRKFREKLRHIWWWTDVTYGPIADILGYQVTFLQSSCHCPLTNKHSSFMELLLHLNRIKKTIY